MSRFHPEGGDAFLSLALGDQAATVKLAEALAAQVTNPDMIALGGPLGAGKTVFARAFIGALGVTGNVPSPTFSLLQSYDAMAGECPVKIHHFDFYRLERAADVWNLGYEETLDDGIAIIEWADRFPRLLPPDRLRIDLRYGSREDERRADLTGFGHWRDKWAAVVRAVGPSG